MGTDEKPAMIERPRLSSGMKRFRRTCGFQLFPPRPGGQLSSGALQILLFLYRDDPYRPVGDWLFEAMRADGVRISRKRFDRCLGELRAAGQLVGDQPPRHMLEGWEESWRVYRREARDPESFTAWVFGCHPG